MMNFIQFQGLAKVRRLLIGLCLSLLGLFSYGSASANLIQWTFTGVVKAGYTDVTGIFSGTVGTALGGDSFSATVVFDTGSSPINVNGCGGTCLAYTTNNTEIYAAITILGNTQSIGTANTNDYIQNNCGFCNLVYRSNTTDASGNGLYLQAVTSTIGHFDGDLNGTYAYTGMNSDSTLRYNNGGIHDINLTVTGFSSRDQNAVPEPAILALVVTALLASGLVARRQARI